jgi:hypothetical protein
MIEVWDTCKNIDWLFHILIIIPYSHNKQNLRKYTFRIIRETTSPTGIKLWDTLNDKQRNAINTADDYLSYRNLNYKELEKAQKKTLKNQDNIPINIIIKELCPHSTQDIDYYTTTHCVISAIIQEELKSARHVYNCKHINTTTIPYINRFCCKILRETITNPFTYKWWWHPKPITNPVTNTNPTPEPNPITNLEYEDIKLILK